MVCFLPLGIHRAPGRKAAGRTTAIGGLGYSPVLCLPEQLWPVNSGGFWDTLILSFLSQLCYRERIWSLAPHTLVGIWTQYQSWVSREMPWERVWIHSGPRGKSYTDGTPRRATHLGGQSCQVGSCQRDISGNLNTRANKRLVEKEGIPGYVGKTGSMSLPPLLTTDTPTYSVRTEPDPVLGTRCVQGVLPSFPGTTDTTALQLS